MHPIWFAQWLWMRAWSAEGLFPLLERNQGFLSLFAMGVAFWFFNMENRRANRETAHAERSEAARRQESLDAEIRDREFKLQAEQREREFLLNAAQKERKAAVTAQLAAEARSRKTEQDREARTVDDYVDACLSLLTPVINGLAVPEAFYSLARGHARIQTQVRGVADRNAMAMGELLRASPRDPEMILLTQGTIQALFALRGEDGIHEATHVQDMIKHQHGAFKILAADFETRRALLIDRIRCTEPVSKPAARKKPRIQGIAT